MKPHCLDVQEDQLCKHVAWGANTQPPKYPFLSPHTAGLGNVFLTCCVLLLYLQDTGLSRGQLLMDAIRII